MISISTITGYYWGDLVRSGFQALTAVAAAGLSALATVVAYDRLADTPIPVSSGPHAAEAARVANTIHQFAEADGVELIIIDPRHQPSAAQIRSQIARQVGVQQGAAMRIGDLLVGSQIEGQIADAIRGGQGVSHQRLLLGKRLCVVVPPVWESRAAAVYAYAGGMIDGSPSNDTLWRFGLLHEVSHCLDRRLPADVPVQSAEAFADRLASLLMRMIYDDTATEGWIARARDNAVVVAGATTHDTGAAMRQLRPGKPADLEQAVQMAVR